MRGKRKLVISVREDVIRRSLLPQLKASSQTAKKKRACNAEKVISLVKARKGVGLKQYKADALNIILSSR